MENSKQMHQVLLTIGTLTEKTAAYIGIAKSRTDMHFIGFRSLGHLAFELP